MKIDRPKITVPYETIDTIVELINFTLLILIWIYPIMVYSDLPDTIPTHLNAQGEPDDFGSKATVWILPAIGTFTFFLIFILNRFPHIHNYMVNITEENALKNYRFSTRIMRFVNLFCMILFGVIMYEIIRTAQGHKPMFLGTWFLIATIVVPIIGLVFIFYYFRKINQ